MPSTPPLTLQMDFQPENLLFEIGPQLIPQPSAFFRRDAFEKVGGISERFQFAFDFDLFLKLSKSGKSSVY